MKGKIIKSKTIISTLIILGITIVLVFSLNKNKNVYVTNVDDLENIKLSMIKVEDEVSTVIKEVPTSGNWYMDYSCEDDNTKLYWDNDNRKILIKEISNTECTVRFEKTKSAINVVSMYVDDVYVGELEESKSYRLLSYECANGEEAVWDGIESSVKVLPLRQNTHCKLYFEEASYLYNQILLDNVVQSDSGISFNSTTGNGLYYTEDTQNYGEDYKRIYYYRGRVENNWVSFGGYLWRIVRTTSEEGIKLAYSGNAGGNTSAFINTETKYNSDDGDFCWGYTYNPNYNYTGAQTNSTIKLVVDSWYNTNLKTYENYLSPTAVYCNDRSSSWYASSYHYFPTYDRINTNKRPTHACPSANVSRYTVSAVTGNGYLTNPIALLTADEINYAGVRWNTGSLNSYIMDNATSINWWLMSPYNNYSEESYNFGGLSSVFLVTSSGSLNYQKVNTNYGVRPSVSLKSCVTVTAGAGTLSNPYMISDKGC